MIIPHVGDVWTFKLRTKHVYRKTIKEFRRPYDHEVARGLFKPSQFIVVWEHIPKARYTPSVSVRRLLCVLSGRRVRTKYGKRAREFVKEYHENRHAVVRRRSEATL